MNKTCLSWRLSAAITATLIVSGCSTSNSSTAASNRNLNKNETPVTSKECDPNYSGCVPIATDVDCAGGPGNGPAYVKGPVEVIGRDIYQLDGDGNGIGCE